MRGKPNFTEKEEVGKFFTENDMKILNLCHIPEEGRLKTLSFSIKDINRVSEILDYGERVDGSSLFSYFEPGKSDIYIIPRIETAFINPFATLPTLNIICDYLDENGRPLDVSPKNVLMRAEERLQSSKNISLKALAELEFYIIARQQTETLFPQPPDRNYHESAPFAKFEDLRNETMSTLDMIGIPTKYGHSEVGQILLEDNTVMEQHEIEFTPQNLTKMAETITIAKWAIRNVCMRHGVSASFIPKIDLSHAGTGMHVHLCALRNAQNIITDHRGTLSDEGLEMIGGILKLASSLAAFGNPAPPSYLRFIARKESPMHICWSARNRLALIRIPLWWNFKKGAIRNGSCRQTFEYRASDAFANSYLVLAGLTVAMNNGLENSEEALKTAKDLHIDATGTEIGKVRTLPKSCSESAESLERDREYYEEGEVFPKKLIDETIKKLKAYRDKNLWKELSTKPEKIERIMMQYVDYG
jgi:glutamine synthetase